MAVEGRAGHGGTGWQTVQPVRLHRAPRDFQGLLRAPRSPRDFPNPPRPLRLLGTSTGPPGPSGSSRLPAQRRHRHRPQRPRRAPRRHLAAAPGTGGSATRDGLGNTEVGSGTPGWGQLGHTTPVSGTPHWDAGLRSCSCPKADTPPGEARLATAPLQHCPSFPFFRDRGIGMGLHLRRGHILL